MRTRHLLLPAAWLLCQATLAAAAASTAPATEAVPAAPAAPPAARQQQLVRMVRQDCGACHGMQLTGGLGPALTPQALADKPLDSMTAVIVHGRPGTPMPPWRGLLTEAEARWIAHTLAQGMPEERTPR
ncbi:cytochrome c [Ideonella sp.]|uniref:c-type cytochrome n=1 Tax=Ideonella sp. TaxID=1929293 RepID=UPI0035B11DDB